MKFQTKKGFTLAELLIVMAIIVVLAAVAIPTFGKQLETSRETSDMEVIRNAYTEALSYAVQDGADGVLDGMFRAKTGDTAPTSLGAVAFATTDDKATYTVTLTTMNNAKFAQNGTVTSSNATGAWTYVGSTLMSKNVPPVNTAVKKLIFTFKIDNDGEVVIDGDDLFSITATGA